MSFSIDVDLKMVLKGVRECFSHAYLRVLGFWVFWGYFGFFGVSGGFGIFLVPGT